jgi:hypothetical protein
MSDEIKRVGPDLRMIHAQQSVKVCTM